MKLHILRPLTAIVAAILGLGSLVARPAHAVGGDECNVGGSGGNSLWYFNSGVGTEADPYLLSTPEDLNELRDCLASGLYFKLLGNIDMTSWNRDVLHSKWDPIGEYPDSNIDTGFAGVLDGGGFSIDNLIIGGGNQQVGFFGKLDAGSQVKNLSLLGTAVGPADVGMLAGVADSAAISNVYVATDVYGGANVGGVIGASVGSTTLNDVTVDPLDSGSAIIAPRASNVGGLIGSYVGDVADVRFSAGNYSTIDIRVSDASPDPLAFQSAGGLFGRLENAHVTTSEADSDVLAPGIAWVGGAIGFANNSSIVETAAHGRVDGSALVGGLLGGSWDNVILSETFATGDVTSYGSDPATGGLVGAQCVTFSAPQLCSTNNSFSRGRVTGAVSSGFAGMVVLKADVSFSHNYSVSTFDSENDESFGFVTADSGDVIDVNNRGNFWNTTVAHLDPADPTIGERGVTSAVMKKFTTYKTAQWDIKQGWTSPESSTTHVWGICKNVNDGYPFLNWAFDANPCAPFTHKPAMFKATKFDLDTSAKKALDVVVADIADQGYTTVNISGYVSLTGKPSKAKTSAGVILSTKRAKVVKTYIAAGLRKKGVIGVIYVTKGFGVASPVAPNKTAAGRAKNDRVQIVVN